MTFPAVRLDLRRDEEMGGRMNWYLSHRADRDCLPLADAHYNRQTPGSPQFVPPGRCVVLKHLLGGGVGAFWVSSWPFAEYVKHDWPGAWINSAFRKDCEGKASGMIRSAIAVTRSIWPDVPALGMVTFIDPKHVKPRMIRSRPTWGHSYLEAGFKHVGYTKAGLWAFQMLPADMPAANEPAGTLFAEVA